MGGIETTNCKEKSSVGGEMSFMGELLKPLWGRLLDKLPGRSNLNLKPHNGIDK